MTPKRTSKDDLLSLINKLPPDKIGLMLEIGRLIKFQIEHEQKLTSAKGGSFQELRPLIGQLALGGDAVEDSEEYWK